MSGTVGRPEGAEDSLAARMAAGETSAAEESGDEGEDGGEARVQGRAAEAVAAGEEQHDTAAHAHRRGLRASEYVRKRDTVNREVRLSESRGNSAVGGVARCGRVGAGLAHPVGTSAVPCRSLKTASGLHVKLANGGTLTEAS